MFVDNKTLYKLWKAVKDIAMDDHGYGIYIEGFAGGAAVYAVGGKAAFRKAINTGDNRRQFVHYLDNRLFSEAARRGRGQYRVLDKNGFLDLDALPDSLGRSDPAECLAKRRFEQVRGAFAAGGQCLADGRWPL